MKIKVHVALCSGHGRCAAFAPEVYALDASGHNDLHLAEVPPELEVSAVRGAVACPERAITLIDPPAWVTDATWRCGAIPEPTAS